MNIQEILEKHEKWLNSEEGGERADLSYANLCGANLCGANLWGANLCGANLWGANLWGTNLCGANLCGANLWGANLCGANLCGANLWGANLCGANLWGVRGNNSQIKSIHCDKYDVAFTKDAIQIGCQRHAIEEWRSFSDDEISKMNDGALEWWATWKPIIFSIIEASPAV